MIIHSVSLSNFRQHADTTVRLGRGLTGLIGPNGSGKSTIIEAIAFAFYGGNVARGTMDTVRWHGAPKTQQADVRVEFSIGGVDYRIMRSESKAWLESDTMGDRIAATPSAVTEEMRRILGLTADEWRSTYLSEQKQVMRLMEMGPEDRRTFMRKVLGVGRLDDAVKAARESANAMERQLLRDRGDVGPREPKAAEVDAARHQVHEAANFATVASLALEEASADHKAAWTAEQKSAEVKAEHDRLTREMEQAQRDAAQAEREVVGLEAEIAECEAAAQRVADVAPQVAALPKLRAERDLLMERRANEQRAADLRAAVKQAEAERDAALARVWAYNAQQHGAEVALMAGLTERVAAADESRAKQQASANATYARAVQEREEWVARIEVLEAATDAACPTCRQPLGDRLAEVIEGMRAEGRAAGLRAKEAREAWVAAQPTDADRALEADLHEVATRIEKHKLLAADADRAAKDYNAAAERVDAAAEALCSLSSEPFDHARLAEVQNQVARLEAVERETAEDRVRAGRAERLRAALLEAMGREEGAALGVSHAGIALQTLAFDPAAHAEAQQRAENARQAREEARAAHSAADATLSAARATLERAEAALSEYDREAEALEQQAEAHRVESRAAERLTALKTAFVQTIIPEMEELVSGFVATLTDGRYESAAIDKDFGVTLYRGGIAVDVASGGEEDVVAIALRLATSLMIAERAGHSLQCVILDEPFGSLDAVRRRNVLDLLTTRLKGLFEQVIVISHFEDVEQAVEHAVVVDYDEVRAASSVRALSLSAAA